MSFVVATPAMVTAAAHDLTSIHSTLSEVTAAAAGPTTAVLAAAEDEVSAGVAALFGAFGQEYQAISAQAAAFHGQFVNLLNAGAAAYISTEAANVEQALLNAVNTPARALLGQSLSEAGTSGATGGAAASVTSVATRAAATSNVIGDTVGAVVGPYESLITNTAANLRSLDNTWINVTTPALLQAVTTPQLIATALGSGNLLSILDITGHAGLGYSNLAQQLTVPISLTLTSLSPSGASFALGVGLPQLLAFDALGAPVNAAIAASASGTAFFGAVQTGNTLAADTALIDAPANIANGLLNGEETLSLSLPLPGLSVTANVPFTGLLVPLQPITATATVPGLPLMNTVTVTGPPAGGLVPALVNYVPELLAAAFTT